MVGSMINNSTLPHTQTHTHTQIYIYMYMYIRVLIKVVPKAPFEIWKG